MCMKLADMYSFFLSDSLCLTIYDVLWDEMHSVLQLQPENLNVFLAKTCKIGHSVLAHHMLMWSKVIAVLICQKMS